MCAAKLKACGREPAREGLASILSDEPWRLHREQARSHGGIQSSKLSNPRQHKGEPRLPFNMSLRALFLLLKGGLLLFLELTLLLRFFAIPIRDQEQTYFFER